jgi:hypothetical protein
MKIDEKLSFAGMRVAYSLTRSPAEAGSLEYTESTEDIIFDLILP